MAYSLIASAGAQQTTSAINTTGADLLVAFMAYDSGATFSDNLGNTWTALTARSHNGSDTFGRFYYVEAPTVGASHTFSSSITYGAVFVQAWANSLSPTAFDKSDGSVSSSGSSAVPPSQTPVENNCVVITAIANGNNTSAYSINSGFTITNSVNAVTGITYGGSMSYKIQTTLGAESPTYSWTGAGATISIATAIFRSAPAGVAIAPKLLMMGIS